jgi:light-regulated signal transduction histidine kinase (bacteriophytochrome)
MATDERDLKREFQNLAYMVVHHLKEPIRSIRTGAELLLENDQNSDPKDKDNLSFVLSCTDRILRGASHLDEIVASVARYADDLNDEDEPVEVTNAETVLRLLRQKLRPLIEQTQAVITNDLLPKIECRPTRFSRLMEHLLRNAIVYHRQEAPPVVHVSAKTEGIDWLFSVRDNGPGIASEYLEQVFDPFRRLHGKEPWGLGMGLATCRSIVTQHGGRIWIESATGAGSTVFFTLPV